MALQLNYGFGLRKPLVLILSSTQAAPDAIKQSPCRQQLFICEFRKATRTALLWGQGKHRVGDGFSENHLGMEMLHPAIAAACQSRQLLLLGCPAKHKSSAATTSSLGQFRSLWNWMALWAGMQPRFIFKPKSKWQRMNFLGHSPQSIGTWGQQLCVCLVI